VSPAKPKVNPPNVMSPSAFLLFLGASTVTILIWGINTGVPTVIITALVYWGAYRFHVWVYNKSRGSSCG
jgi:hypothetical protein